MMKDHGSRFIGRRHEQRRLEALLGADAGGVRLVCVVGPAGIGKSRLVEETTAGVVDTVRTLWTRCWDGPATPSLWPWLQVVDQLGVDVPPDELALDAPRDRFRQFETLARAVEAPSRDGRATTIVIEDLHWADPSSVEFLRFVMRRPAAGPLVVVATYRPADALAVDGADAVVLLERDAEVFRLAGLPRSDVGELLSERVGRAVPDDVAADLHERTGGNPFYLGELARVAPPGDAVRSVDAWAASSDVTLAAGVHRSIEQHVGLVDASVRPTLLAAAIQGRIFDQHVLIEALDVEPGQVAADLSAARSVGLVHAAVDHWRFDHALIGEVLLAAASAEELAAGHLSTARALATTSLDGRGVGREEQIAAHLVRARPLVSADEVVAALRTAAAAAGRRVAWEAQSGYLQTAAAIVRSEPALDESLLIDLLLERCVADKRCRRLDAAKEAAVAAANIARDLADPILLARVALEFPPDAEAIDIDDIADPDQRAVRREALDALGDRHPAWRSRLEAALALSLYWDNSAGDRGTSWRVNARERDELTSAALETARSLDDDRCLAVAIHGRLFANFGIDHDRAEWAALADELVQVAARIDDPVLGLAGRYARITDLFERGRLEQVATEVAAYERDAERLGSRIDVWVSIRWRANLALLRGDLDEADRLTMEAYELGQQLMPDDVAFNYVASMSGPGQYLRCELAGHLELFQQNSDETENVPAWRIGVAFIAAEADRFDLARPELRAVATDGFAMMPRDLNYSGALVPAALAAHRIGDVEVAAAVERDLRPLSGRLAIHGPGYTSYGAYDLAIAQCLHTRGRLAEAVGFYESGIAQCADVGSPYGLVGRMHLGRALTELDPPRAARELERAISELDAAGLHGMADRARHALDAHRASVEITVTEGSPWLIERGVGRRIELAGIKGLRVLGQLLAAPGRDIHALELAAAMNGAGLAAAHGNAPDVRSDRQAITEYRERLDDLRRRLERADRRGDADDSREAHEEIEALLAALAEAEGFAGRLGAMPDEAGRARVNMTKHIRRAIDRIAAADADLGAHLSGAVTTGFYCRYDPGDSGFRWTVSFAGDVTASSH